MISRKLNIWQQDLRRGCVIKSFHSTLFCKYLCFSSFHPSLIWFAIAGPLIIFLSLPPPFSVMTISWDRSPQPRKSLRGFRKLSRRPTMTRRWWECRYTWFIKRRSRRNGSDVGRSEKSHCKCFYCQYRRRSGEWPARVSGNSLRPMTCQPERFTPLS